MTYNSTKRNTYQHGTVRNANIRDFLALTSTLNEDFFFLKNLDIYAAIGSV